MRILELSTWILCSVAISAYALPAFAVTPAGSTNFRITTGTPGTAGRFTVKIKVKSDAGVKKNYIAIADILATDTPEQKAEKVRAAIQKLLDMEKKKDRAVTAEQEKNKQGVALPQVLIRNKAGWRLRKVKVEEDGTGEADTVSSVDPNSLSSCCLDVGLDIFGTPEGGQLAVRVGDLPEILIQTAGRTSVEIEQEVAASLFGLGVEAFTSTTPLIPIEDFGDPFDGSEIQMFQQNAAITTQVTDPGLVLILSLAFPDPIFFGIAEEVVSAGGTLTTDPDGVGASPEDRLVTSVTSPGSGLVSIFETSITRTPPADYVFIGQEGAVFAPSATPSDPVVLHFTLDAIEIPVAQDETTIHVFRNEVPVGECAGSPGEALPDPCVVERSSATGGDPSFSILTSHTSDWNFGISATRDIDGDSEADVTDNCPVTPNAGQADVDEDGIGDGCQCGDVDDDGIAGPDDTTTFRQQLADPSGHPLSVSGISKCTVIGAARPCDVLDLVVLRRALAEPSLPPGIAQVCTAAVGT